MHRKIGAHKSISGGYDKALERVFDIGGNCLQIFSSSPRGWKKAELSDSEINKFKLKKEELNIDPVYFHATYLINLTDEGRVGHLSKDNLINELSLASKIGVCGSVVHLGSFKNKEEEKPAYLEDGYEVLIGNIKEVLEKSKGDSFFIIENSANRKVGRYLEGLMKIVNDLDDKRVKVCFDTCHLHAAGYDISTKKALDKFLDEVDKKIGLDKLEVWHLNDSKDNFGSLRDRHENIGEGEVGKGVFKNLLNHPKMVDTPFIIETPGFDEKGPDKKNIDILKNMID
jgi:deoxyribonuclease-4